MNRSVFVGFIGFWTLTKTSKICCIKKTVEKFSSWKKKTENIQICPLPPTLEREEDDKLATPGAARVEEGEFPTEEDEFQFLKVCYSVTEN